MSAGADEALTVATAYQFHFLVADPDSGVCTTGNRFTISAFPVLAYKHLAVFPIHLQHIFATLRALVPGQIVVAECAGGAANLLDQHLCILLDLRHELPVGLPAPGDGLQAQLPT